MSKPFIEAALLLGLVLVLQACGSNPSKPSSDSGGGAVAASTSGPPTLDLSSIPHEAGPAPDVKKGNEAAFAQAVSALREQRLREAEVLLLEITSDQPELAGPWINLGQVYVGLEQPEEARLAFQNAVRANPHNCTAHNELGVLSRQHGDFSGAEEHYRTCIELVPGYKDAYLNLGILYELYLGRLSEALDYYRRYQALLPEPDRRVQGWVMDLERRLGV